MRLFTTTLAAAILAGPAILQAQLAPGPGLVTGRQVAARYDSAFASVVRSARRDTATFSWLLELAQFKAERVGWGFVDHGTIRAVTNIVREAYFLVVPYDDPAYQTMRSVMQSDPTASMYATLVTPDTISRPWAGVFLTFELSRMRDHVLGLMPQPPAPEHLAAATRRAYGAEYLALRAVGGRALDQHLDSVLVAANPQSLMALAQDLPPMVQKSFHSFDALISSQSALTEREESRRGGAYAVALLLRYAEQRRFRDADFAAAVQCIGGCRP